MESMEVNKAVASVLVAGITFMVAGLVGDALVHPKHYDKLAIKIDVPQQQNGVPAEPQDPPVAALLVSASASDGENLTKQQGCVACHSFNEGGKAGVGPNLYGVLGAPHGHMAGYEYSTALKSKQGPWTYDELYDWLKKPSTYAPGTKMTYAGLADPKKRADIIMYLRSLSANPEPLPAPPAQNAAASGSATPATSSNGPPVSPAAPAATPIADRLENADAAAGQKDTMKLGCIACHSFNEGGKAGLGPNLWGVVGGPHAHMPGFAYSAALKSHEGPWTYEELDKWLTKPAAYAPGTKMSFAGIPDPNERADVIAYLRSLSDKPMPLPGGAKPGGAAPASAPVGPQPAEAGPDGAKPAEPPQAK